MYLKRLEMQGFKSFADKTVLEFMPGITSVIGPNGSGKSNISDCIRWVLGEQSMKSLRSAKTQDVIFAGTQNRKSLGYAEASLIFDNSDKVLPIEYAEVTITRKIYRSGETNYYINKAQCRLKDIQELFMDTGIGKDGYSIIGQGKIDEILSNKSEDRRHIFEEAAGIVKYKTRKEETEKKLEHTKLNLLRINDILAELEQNLEPLKNQSDKAKKYLNLREELKSIEVGLFIYNINKYKKELEQVLEDENIMNTTYTAEEEKLNLIKETKEKLKQEIQEIEKQAEHLQNLGFESQKMQEKFNSDIQIAKTNINNNFENKARYEQEKKEAQDKIVTIEEDQKNKLGKVEDLKARKAQYKEELEQKEKELEKISSKLTEKEKEIEQQKRRLEENTERKYELQNKINIEETNGQNLEKRMKQVKQEISNNVLELDSTRMQKEDISKQFYKIENNKNKLSKELEDNSSEKEKIEKELQDIEKDINIKKENLRMKQTRQQFLIETEKEKEGFTKSVKELLKACEKNQQLSQGLNGVLAQILEVPKEYETAIEMCLGANLQNIVTETEEDAKRMINYLRENNLGRASFFPISAMKGTKLEKIKGKENILGIASDIVKVDKKYEQLVLNLLGRTVIVKDMQTGINLAKQNSYSFRIVTKEGDILNTSGMLSGGSVAKKSISILGRGREIETLDKEITKLKQEITNLENEKNKILEKTQSFMDKIDELTSQLQEINITYATEKQKVENIDQNIQKIKDRLEKFKQEEQNIKEQKEQTEIRKNQCKVIIEEISKENEINEQKVKEFTDNNKENQKVIDDLNFDITNLKISVSSFEESENSIEEITAILQKDLENQKKLIEQKETQIKEIEENNKLLENSIEEINIKIEKTKQEAENSGVEIEKIKNQKVENNKKLSEQEEEQINQFNKLEEIKAQIVKLDVKKSKLDDLVNDNINLMWQEYELTPNNAGEYKEPENVSFTQRKVNNLRQDIKELGSVNIDSIEDYKNLKQRYDFMCEQRLDLDNTISKLRNIITDMVSTMKVQFKEKFDIINKNFNDVFKELFGGGKAELVLTDENNILESGIEIVVQPPGKTLKNMLLLSGGERALTAIALLFAILKINPSPFCVLDEIEAALDDVNVFRFAEYLKKFVGETQFLVITHRKGTMEVADTVYGVTMEEKGISKLLSMKLK